MKYLLRDLLIIVLAVTGIWFVITPLHHIGISRPYAQDIAAGHIFDAKELDSFLRLWQKANSGYVKNYMPAASLDEKSRSSIVFLRWLKLHNWNENRFFYDEQRLRDLAECVELQNNADDNFMMQRRTAAHLEDLLKLQKQKLSLCEYSDDELKLVRNNLSVIKTMMPDIYLMKVKK